MLTKKLLKTWSDRAKISRYVALYRRIKALSKDKRLLTLLLQEVIPPGETLYGVQHQLANVRNPDVDALKRLGYWDDVSTESVDAEKLNALLQLRPELEQLVLLDSKEKHTLVIREEHK